MPGNNFRDKICEVCQPTICDRVFVSCFIVLSDASGINVIKDLRLVDVFVRGLLTVGRDESGLSNVSLQIE